MTNIDAETQELLKDTAAGKYSAIVPDGTNWHYDGYKSYSFTSYRNCVNELISEGIINAIYNEIDVRLGDRTATVPDAMFQFASPQYAPEIRDGIYGNAVITAAVKSIISKAGVSSGMDKREAAKRLAREVSTFFIYDESYVSADMTWAIQNHRGVCYHYATLFTYVCKSCGIPCINVTNDRHVWNVTNINGAIEYTDTTYYGQCNDEKYVLMTETQCLASGDHSVSASNRAKIISAIKQAARDV